MNEATLNCRGLITYKNEIIARGFSKFFNWEELGHERQGKIQEQKGIKINVTWKMDGSLGILYVNPKGQWAVSTRGSFDSPQAKRATELLHDEKVYGTKTIKQLDPSLSYLVEIIFPENRIVVDYGDKNQLILLAVLDTGTGATILPNTQFSKLGFPLVEQFEIKDQEFDLKELHNLLLKQSKPNAEGFVVHIVSDAGESRFKVKFQQYKSLHIAKSKLSNKQIWSILSCPFQVENKEKKNDFELDLDWDSFIKIVPDEAHEWIRDQVEKLTTARNKLETECKKIVDDAKVAKTDNKTLAAKYSGPTRNIIFAMINGKATPTFALEIN